MTTKAVLLAKIIFRSFGLGAFGIGVANFFIFLVYVFESTLNEDVLFKFTGTFFFVALVFFLVASIPDGPYRNFTDYYPAAVTLAAAFTYLVYYLIATQSLFPASPRDVVIQLLCGFGLGALIINYSHRLVKPDPKDLKKGVEVIVQIEEQYRAQAVVVTVRGETDVKVQIKRIWRRQKGFGADVNGEMCVGLNEVFFEMSKP